MTSRFFRVKCKVVPLMLSSRKDQDSMRQLLTVWIPPRSSGESWWQQGGRATLGNEWSRAKGHSMWHKHQATHMELIQHQPGMAGVAETCDVWWQIWFLQKYYGDSCSFLSGFVWSLGFGDFFGWLVHSLMFGFWFGFFVWFVCLFVCFSWRFFHFSTGI